VPILDSAERVGLLGITVPEGSELEPWRQLASLAGELFVSKARYGDHLSLRRRTQDTSVAAEMRWSLLPPLSFRSERLTISGILEPAYDIAGDTFDYAVNGDTAHVALLDAMGHGLEASRMANLAVMSYRHSRRTALSLPDTAKAMDEVVQASFDGSRYVTGQLATLEVTTGLFRMLNMGHPLPLLIRDGRVVGELASEPMLPAGWGDKPGAIREHRLVPGDYVLMYTDGITEAKDRNGEQYRLPRLIAAIESVLARGAPVEELLREIIEEVMAFQDFHARDDATVLAVGYHPQG
jgi:serine phosphatase RsbU (regulator of sigma subunit)